MDAGLPNVSRQRTGEGCDSHWTCDWICDCSERPTHRPPLGCLFPERRKQGALRQMARRDPTLALCQRTQHKCQCSDLGVGRAGHTSAYGSQLRLDDELRHTPGSLPACARLWLPKLGVRRYSAPTVSFRRLFPIVALGAVTATTVAYAGNPYAYEPAAPETTRANQYASMSAALCLAELTERGVPFERVSSPRGIETPLRLTGPIRGVRYSQSYGRELDPARRRHSGRRVQPGTVLDCRLGLALDDFSRVLAKHAVVQLEYLSMYRPGHMRPGVRHPAGRAIDVATLTLADGTLYSVRRHFFGRAGAQTCGIGADEPTREHPGARLWREIVCELDLLRSFNLVLTPNYDWGHRDHLHLEVRSAIRWFLTQ